MKTLKKPRNFNGMTLTDPWFVKELKNKGCLSY